MNTLCNTAVSHCIAHVLQEKTMHKKKNDKMIYPNALNKSIKKLKKGNKIQENVSLYLYCNFLKNINNGDTFVIKI